MSRKFFATPPRGFSLVELLVATTIGLAIMAGIASLFSVFGRSMSQSQATVELSARLRSTAWQLRQDLAGATANMRAPWTQPESNTGYFELIEGPMTDTTNAIASGTATSNLTGDIDDILLFTTQSLGPPFVGKFGIDTIEAPYAEIAWFCRPSANQAVNGTVLYNLYRRQLLVSAFVGKGPFFYEDLNDNNTLDAGEDTNNDSVLDKNFNRLPLPYSSVVLSATVQTLADAGQFYDLSLRQEGSALLPNSLGDLVKRENRFLRSGTFTSGANIVISSTFPYAFPVDPVTLLAVPSSTFDNTNRVWEDVLLTNVVAFDVRVFDPQVRAQSSGGVTLYPGDLAYIGSASMSGTGALGAYVDLGWGGGAVTSISGTFPPVGQTAFQSSGVAVRNGAATNLLRSATYDTWSRHYEFNGVDDDRDGITDEGSNGIDNDGDDLPDNQAESETWPPYPVPLRGVEVRIRCYEPTSKQIRQITIRHSFIAR